jgi:MYXO-CTERM domain-containing protein
MHLNTTRLLAYSLLLSGSLVEAQAHAADFYVAPSGSDTAPGSKEQPFASVKRAETAAAPGDTVFLRGGVYRFSGTSSEFGIAFTKSGSTDKPIHYVAFPGEVPIFDLFELKPQARVTGLDVRCNWIHLRGLEVRGVRQVIVGDSWSVRIRGDHNLIEQLNVHDGQAPGIFITSGAHNLVLNCDSHHNYDPLEAGGNADGFGCHSSGGDNVLRGCRAWENSDDGFDFINAAGTCTAERSWSFRNGYIPDTDMAGANGGGFKAGGFGEPPNVPATGVPRHLIRWNVAFGNRAIGIYANHHPGGIDFFNNTAFDNPANFDMRPPASGSATMHKLRNNIATGTGRTIINLNGGTDTSNSWTLPVQVSSADFVSLDKALALMPRQADGSLPNVGLGRLVPGSDLIDRGEDVGLPFQGKAPDLGAYELGGDEGGSEADSGARDAGITADASGPRPGDAGQPTPDAADAAPPEAGAASTTPSQGNPTSAAPANSATPDGGASTPPRPSQSPSDSEDGDAITQADGCGCRVGAPAGPRDALWGMAVAAALALLGRRRGRG